ncbi:alpha/beta fold hydrolase [Variovorax sp. J22P168]|uniref:alpha/beta fold hydrolase n=1 Tax=Variovorax jilinensis TaxID=3053513 RepID=UPI0025758DB2|nr:alpha/beta fold hydrolase [Variovorax sp. J22P168]MDM0014710.1 alpha/beta fold hydrolase [Variovorax sp. J22P168]
MRGSLTMGSRWRRIAVVLALSMLTGACGLLQVDGQMRRLDVAMYFTGIVQTEGEARAPIVVVLHTVDESPKAVYVDVVPRGKGVYHLAAPPGRYAILAFEDLNRNLRLDAGERAVVRQGTALGLDAIDNPPTPATGLDSILIASSTPATVDPAIFGAPYAALLKLRAEEFGAPATIAEERFSPERVRQGLFEPLRFLREGRSGLFMLEPYNRERIPVIFVHGIGGSPRDWEHVIEKLDRKRFQPWVFFYPSGVPMSYSAMLLSNAVDDLYYRYAFATSIVVAHSMGGLVVRGAYNISEREGRTPPVHHVVTISTPWLGHSAGRWANVGPTRVPGSWIDMAPDSPYLHELTVVPRPGQVRHTLFFGYGGRSPLVGGNNDGIVAVQSMLDPDIQSRADAVVGFDEDHMSILRSDAMNERLARRLQEELR